MRIDHILMKITKETGEKPKHLYKDSVTRKDALQAIFAQRFTIAKVDLFCLNVTSNQHLQNLPHLSNVVVVSENISVFFGLISG